jgi:hypothetical protein
LVFILSTWHLGLGNAFISPKRLYLLTDAQAFTSYWHLQACWDKCDTAFSSYFLSIV